MPGWDAGPDAAAAEVDADAAKGRRLTRRLTARHPVGRARLRVAARATAYGVAVSRAKARTGRPGTSTRTPEDGARLRLGVVEVLAGGRDVEVAPVVARRACTR